MISVAQCAAFAGLASNELVLGVAPSARHHWLLSSYLLNLGQGPRAVRDMIVADLRTFLDLGARQRAADLLIVLRFFLTDHPEGKRARREHEQEDVFPVPSGVLYRDETRARSRSGDGARASKKETPREVASSSHARVARAEECLGEEEGGVVHLFSRRHPMHDGAPRSERRGVDDRVRSARARAESGGRIPSEGQDGADLDGPRRWPFRLLTNKDAN